MIDFITSFPPGAWWYHSLAWDTMPYPWLPAFVATPDGPEIVMAPARVAATPDGSGRTSHMSWRKSADVIAWPEREP
jgi:hypothetical protein